MTTKARLLGFAPLTGLDALRGALNVIAGPPVHACHGPGIAALLQPEADAPLFASNRKALTAALLTVQRRLEVACQAGPFLPMDPAAAVCAADTVSVLLQPAWQALAAALPALGARHQWDVVLRWEPEPVIAAHRDQIAAAAQHGKAALAEAVGAVLLARRSRCEAELLTALAPAVRAFAAGGAACTETEIAVTVLVNAGQEAPVEAALDALPAGDATIDMRGPLPPLNFAAVRIATVQAADIARAWRLLDLPDRIDPAALHRQWRLKAATVHPDRRPAHGTVTVSDLTAAHRLLRPLLPTDRFETLNGLLRHAGPRLVVPEDTAAAPEPAREPLMELVS